MSKKVALITGITGQDGSYLAEFLLKKGYEIHGLYRRSSSFNTSRIEHLYMEDVLHDTQKHVTLHYGDLTDCSSLVSIIQKVRPTEVYHLAAQSHVKVSFEVPGYTAEVNCLGTLNLLEAIRIAKMEKDIRFYNAVTSELYGLVQAIPQKETTPFYPRSPYAVSKLYAFWIVKNYRESYNMFLTNGILFNHESERRGENFVTRKITIAVGRIHHGLQNVLKLGNLDAKRDWGYAPDYVELMWKMLQHPKPDDFVVATGQTHTVKKFCELSFAEVGVELVWEGKAEKEKGLDKKTGRVYVEVDPTYYRPAEVDILIGDPTRAVKELGWNPSQTPLEVMVKKMVANDLKIAERIKALK